MPTRAEREAASPPLLGAAQARHSLPERAFADRPGLFSTKTKTLTSRQAVPGGGAVWGGEERKAGVGARSALR